MAENGVMERKKQIFQIDHRLKDMFNQYCAERGLIQEQLLEAMVYLLVEKGLPGSVDRDNLLQEVAAWKAGISPGEAGQAVESALQRGVASRKRSQKNSG